MSSAGDILKWLSRTFSGVVSRENGETQFSCPYCGHSSFYFNLYKQKGHCHRDSCHKSPSLKSLVLLVGHGPEDGEGGLFELEEDEPQEEPELSVILPPSQPLLAYHKGKLVTCDQAATEAVMGRGLSTSAILGWGLTYDGKRVYIPLMYKDILVQWIGRMKWWGEIPMGLRYKYAEGINIMQFLLGWDEARLWDDLLLVENSFNAIAYRSLGLPAASNFGSHLSEIQIGLIVRSRIKRVVLMWDEGSYKAAEKAVHKLRKEGVAAIACKITGQPDSHSLTWVKTTYSASLDAMRKGDISYGAETKMEYGR